MSTTSGNTQYTYAFTGNSLVETPVAPFTVSLSSTGVPGTFSDTVAITLATALQSAWRTAGFADAVVTVTKAVNSSTQYSVTGGVFV